MGCPPLAACLWVLGHLLSHLPPIEGDQTMSCGPHFCSINSCCLYQRMGGGHTGPWVCGCPPGMAPTPQNSSIFSCQELHPKPEPTCNISILEEAKTTCGDTESEAAACAQLQATRRLLQDACSRPTQENLQVALAQLHANALAELRSNATAATALLLRSTEALVLQAALTADASGPRTFNTSIMEAAVEVVGDRCPQTLLTLTVGNETLSISCHEVLSRAQGGAVAFIVYNEVDELLNNITESEQGIVISSVVGSSVGKPGDTFDVPFNVTLQHLEVAQPGRKLSCVFWQTTTGTKGQWNSTGCTRVGGDSNYSICHCTHFSTFSILMATQEVPENFALEVVTYVGLSVSLVCLFLTILTFLLCRSLWSVSIALHTQLSICLFAANLLFLVGTSNTANRLACAITAGFLHYLFLACFAWMFLEGLHLFLTIRNLSVLNYTSASRFRKRYIYPVGYGTPAIVVAISAAVRPGSYGTKHSCWLSLEGGFIWSFLGPICVIILVNLLFFLIILWTLKDKLSSLNADVTALKNTRLMMFKVLMHICILGCTWGLGLLRTQGDNTAVDFIFTIVNSLQGAIIFLVHCILNRQVTEQYRSWFRALRRRTHPQEMPTTEIQITYVTEGERLQSHSTEGCTWEK